MTETLKPLSECKAWLEHIQSSSPARSHYESALSPLAHIDALEKRETAAKEALEHAYKKFAEIDQKARETLRMIEEGK